MVSALDLRSEGQWFGAWLCHCVVSVVLNLPCFQLSLMETAIHRHLSMKVSSLGPKETKISVHVIQCAHSVLSLV